MGRQVTTYGSTGDHLWGRGDHLWVARYVDMGNSLAYTLASLEVI